MGFLCDSLEGVRINGQFREQLHQAFSLLSRIGWNSIVAFFISTDGSAPLIMLVKAMPKTSRNSVTGTITGKPGCEILAEATMQSTHAFGAFSPASASGLRYAELCTGAPAAAWSKRAW